MPRIPDDELERLKREVSLQRLCEKYGIALQPHGKDLIGLCPFHDDKSPSFVVTPSNNLWHCLGACGKGGSNVDFIMRKESVSFRRAVEILRECAGYAPEPARLTTRMGTAHPILVQPAPDLADRDLLDAVRDYYHKTFLNDPKAMTYLRQRSCLHPEAIATFKLGYANRTLGYRIPRTIDDGKALKARLQQLGIMRESGHEHLSGSVVLPILDRHGRTVGLYGRKVTPNLREGTPNHLYLPGEHRGVWNEAALAGQKEWLLCEALLDALTLWCAGFRNVTASYGVNGFTPDHWRLLDELKPSRVILCYDNDAAGNAAAEALRPQLEARGIAVRRARLPDGQDVNDVARVSKNPTAALAAVIEAALLESSSHAPAASSLSLAAIAAKKETPPAPVQPAPPVISPTPATPPAPATAAIVATPEPPAESPSAPSAPPRETSPEPICVHPRASAVLSDSAPAVTQSPDAITITLGDRVYRVRGLAKNTSFEVLKINLRVSQNAAFHVDNLDLYQARNRQAFVSQAAEELSCNPETIRKDLGRVLLKLEELQEAAINQALEPEEKAPIMTAEERAAALELLRDPKLLERILADFDRCGTVGEETNKLLGYLAAVSRKLDEPLAILIQSTSAAGKTALMDAVLALLPDEDKVKYSAMTGQSLFYLGDLNLQHKVLAIVEEEGALKASYALKLLQSEGELTIASTGKDPNTGRMVTQEYHVEGPVMIVMTTTSIEIGEELQNRCIVLTVDETREQTRAIHRVQRERYTLEGLLAKRDRETIRRTHQNAQRLLRPLGVLNPFARQLTFLDDKTRTRRDHEKYLTLIAAITLLRQYQRPVKTREHGGRPVEYIEATLDDIAVANRLAAEALGRSLDELPPQTRRFLGLLTEMVTRDAAAQKIEREDHRFTQRDARTFTGWTDVQVKRHLAKLVDLEYVLVHRGGRGQSFVYELLYEGQGENGGKFVLGLIDAGTLYDTDRDRPNADRDHEKGDRDLSGTAQVLAKYAPGTPATNATSPNSEGPLLHLPPETDENARPRHLSENSNRKAS
jgi:DNA primase catalytic core